MKLSLAISAIVLGVFLQPTTGWSTRAYSPAVTGSVTATPLNGSIEVDHHVYRVKANSAAAKALSSFYVGETVDMIFDGPPGTTAEVISIMRHPGS